MELLFVVTKIITELPVVARKTFRVTGRGKRNYYRVTGRGKKLVQIFWSW